MKRKSQTIEFKESWRDEYLRWICAFANTQGGKFYLGINDDGKGVGLKDAKRLMEDFWSSGVMPHELNERNIYMPHPSYPRNKHLADAFYLMCFIETWGRGLHKICTLISHAKQKRPLVEPTPEGLRVTFFRPNTTLEKALPETIQKIRQKSPQKTAQKTAQKIAQKIILLVECDNKITIAGLADKCGCSVRMMNYHLSSLKAAGRLRRIGPDKGGHWEVVEL